MVQLKFFYYNELEEIKNDIDGTYVKEQLQAITNISDDLAELLENVVYLKKTLEGILLYVSDIQVNHANLARDKDMQHNKKLDKVILMLRLKLFPIADLKHRLKLLPSVELGLSRKQSLKNQQIIKANPLTGLQYIYQEIKSYENYLQRQTQE